MQKIEINQIEKINDGKIIDIRDNKKFKLGSIPGSINIPLMGLMYNYEQLINEDEKYYIICTSGASSAQVTQHLAAKGYNVVNINGGYSKYIQQKSEN